MSFVYAMGFIIEQEPNDMAIPNLVEILCTASVIREAISKSKDYVHQNS